MRDQANEKLAHNLGTFIGMKQLRVLLPIITCPRPSVGRSKLKSRLLKRQMVVMVASIKYFTAVSGKVVGKRTKVYAKISKKKWVSK